MAGGSEVTSSRPLSSWEAREPCIPGDVDHAGLTKAHGKVTLPLSVYWSGPSPVYDLDDPRERARAYEQVLREGTDDDVRRFVEVDQVIELWDRMVIPPSVRRAWAHWLREHRGVILEC